jgi:glyoxylase-like metal-dependent hydrolase (beta-lactamase superfamily II)
MKLYPIETGNFKLDGGAMFGVVPKTIWNKTNPADPNNLIDIAARCLLIEDGDRLILVDTGLGNKQSEKFFGYYSLWGDHSMDKSLAKFGFHRDDVTDVFLTHLHFDHCGGSIQWNKDRTGYEPAFKNAKFWSNDSHWDWATKPNAREKASFLSENILPMQESGQLNFIKRPEGDTLENSELGLGIFFRRRPYRKNDDPENQIPGQNHLLYGRPIADRRAHSAAVRHGLRYAAFADAS